MDSSWGGFHFWLDPSNLVLALSDLSFNKCFIAWGVFSYSSLYNEIKCHTSVLQLLGYLPLSSFYIPSVLKESIKLLFAGLQLGYWPIDMFWWMIMQTKSMSNAASLCCHSSNLPVIKDSYRRNQWFSWLVIPELFGVVALIVPRVDHLVPLLW